MIIKPAFVRITPIKWADAKTELPDSDITLIVGLANGEMWLGFHDGNFWRSFEGEAIDDVEYWTDLLEVPTRPKAKPGKKNVRAAK